MQRCPPCGQPWPNFLLLSVCSCPIFFPQLFKHRTCIFGFDFFCKKSHKLFKINALRTRYSENSW
nr:MAG TPA: PhnA Zinc-Ribbon [Caudoviricetes sp.]